MPTLYRHMERTFVKPVSALQWNIFTDHSKVVLLLWIVCVIYVLCLSCFRVCSLLPCGHLKGKGWPLGSCLWYLLWFCCFPIGYPGTVVVLDCIDSWSLLFFLLQPTWQSTMAATVKSGLQFTYFNYLHFQCKSFYWIFRILQPFIAS